IEPGPSGSSAILRSPVSSHSHEFHLFRAEEPTHHRRQLIAVDLRHPNIEKDDLRIFVQDLRQRIACVGDKGRLTIHGGQQPCEGLGRIAVVIHHDSAVPCFRGGRHKEGLRAFRLSGVASSKIRTAPRRPCWQQSARTWHHIRNGRSLLCHRRTSCDPGHAGDRVDRCPQTFPLARGRLDTTPSEHPPCNSAYRMPKTTCAKGCSDAMRFARSPVARRTWFRPGCSRSSTESSENGYSAKLGFSLG